MATLRKGYMRTALTAHMMHPRTPGVILLAHDLKMLICWLLCFAKNLRERAAALGNGETR